MMIKPVRIKVKNVDGGWDTFIVPDDLEIKIILNDESITCYGSLRELLTILEDLNNRQEFNTFLGPYCSIKIKRKKDNIYLDFNEGDLIVSVPYKDFVNELTSAIQKVIKIKDGRDPSSKLKEKYLEKYKKYLKLK
jgi:hypothetical protein